MLTILNDPSGITGRRRHPWDFTKTLQQNIETHLSGGADAELRINGRVVDPLSDRRLDMPPSRNDVVVVVLRPRGGFNGLLNTLSFGIIGGPVIGSLIPKLPGQDGGSGKDSPNNRLTGQSNIARAYQGIPDVYGYRRVWPDLIQPSTAEYIDQLKYVTEWLCISRGKGTIAAVQYAETPIGDIDGSSYEIFEPSPVGGYPENGTTTLNDVFETFASDEVNGQELPYAVAYTPLSKSGTFNAVNGATTFTITLTDGPDLAELKGLSPSGTALVAFTYTGPTSFSQTCTVLSYVVSAPNVTFTFSSTAWSGNQSGASTFNITPNGTNYTTLGAYTLPIDASRIWWNVVFLRGLQGSVTIRAEWWKVDTAGTEIAGTRQSQDYTYTAATFDQRFYTEKVTPSGGEGRYRVQFQRRSVQVGSAGADVAKLEELYAVRYFATKQVPGVTVMRVTTKATLSATGFSDRKFNLRWLRHVRGLVDATLSASRNFARSLAHIWTIAGYDTASLDTDALQFINDELGENSPLLRFDGSLDDADMALGRRMQLMADGARCQLWRDGTKWTISRDQAKPFHEMQFDYRNLAARGESQINYAAHLPASNDGVELEYVDETTQAKKAYVRLNISTGVPVAGTSKNPKRVKLSGCCTLEQAENRAQLEARRLLFQRVSVTDTALSDAAALGLLSLIRWVDPNDFGGDELQAGEVMSIAGSVITTSEPLNWGGHTTGRICFTGEDGRRLGPAVECIYLSEQSLQLLSVQGGIYVADATRQCGSRYAFAVGLTSEEMEAAGLYSVTQVRPSSDGTVSLAFSNYDARIYEGDA